MTTQIANIARIQGTVAHVYLTDDSSPGEHIHGKITGVDGVGLSITEAVPEGEPRAAEQFFPWASIRRIVRA